MKKNKKGFTLIELIVVMALMAIIMGALMMLMRPTNSMYTKVNNQTYEESVCIDISKLIGNEIKYARTVSVVSCPSGGVPSSITGSRYFKIDNVNARSTSKKHATGLVTKGTISGTSFTQTGTVMAEDAYGEDTYIIKIGEYSTETTSNFITLHFESMPRTFTSGAYTNDTETVFKYDRAIEFTNINNKTILNNKNANLNVDTSSSNDTIYIMYEPASENP